MEHNAKEYKIPLVNFKCSKPCCGDKARLAPLLSSSRAQWPFCPRHEADLGRSWEGSLRALLPAWRALNLERPAGQPCGQFSGIRSQGAAVPAFCWDPGKAGQRGM